MQSGRKGEELICAKQSENTGPLVAVFQAYARSLGCVSFVLGRTETNVDPRTSHEDQLVFCRSVASEASSDISALIRTRASESLLRRKKPRLFTSLKITEAIQFGADLGDTCPPRLDVGWYRKVSEVMKIIRPTTATTDFASN